MGAEGSAAASSIASSPCDTLTHTWTVRRTHPNHVIGYALRNQDVLVDQLVAERDGAPAGRHGGGALLALRCLAGGGTEQREKIGAMHFKQLLTQYLTLHLKRGLRSFLPVTGAAMTRDQGCSLPPSASLAPPLVARGYAPCQTLCAVVATYEMPQCHFSSVAAEDGIALCLVGYAPDYLPPSTESTAYRKV